MKKQQKIYFRIFSVLALISLLSFQLFGTQSATAAQITNRKLTLLANGTTGGSKAGGTVNHEFSFNLPTSASVGSIRFLYCTTASGSCTTPAGLSTSGATLGAQTGLTGFTLDTTTNGSPYVTRTAASGNGAVVIRLDGVVNPTTNNERFFVRISSFTSSDTTTGLVDTGTVVASTAEPIILDGVMPESLVFCTGETIGLTGGVPDCAAAGTTDGTISFNQLFSPTDTATATSQMAASTNAGAGYAITVNGTTLTSGSNSIAGMGTSGPSTIVRGTAQFGLNLKANTNAVAASFPGTSAEVSPLNNGTNYKGRASANYGTGDSFRFVTGDVVAASDDGGAGGSDSQIFTVSYVTNVPGSQPAGTYTTTLTYICTPTF